MRSLVLANTGARIGSVESWTARIALVREGGMKAVADLAMPLWFTDAFRAREAATVQQFRQMVESCPVDGYLGCCAALRDEDLREALGSIRCPVLAIAGAHDRATAPELLHLVNQRVPQSRLVTLDAAHHQQRRAGRGVQRLAVVVPRRARLKAAGLKTRSHVRPRRG